MDAIVLAAGNSSRFGSNKLLHEINGKQMHTYMIEHLSCLQKQGFIDRVILVTQYEEMKEAICIQNHQMEVVMNVHPEQGISHSVFLGLERLMSEEDTTNYLSESCLFAVSDQPYLQYDSLVGFVEAYHRSHQKIGICAYENRMGNPVIFSRLYYEELRMMSGDKGGKQVVVKHLEDTFLFQVEERELEDIDVRNTGSN